MAAIEKDGKNWQGPLVAPMRYSTEKSSTSHAGVSGMTVSQIITGGGVKDLTGVLTTTNGSGAAIKEFSGKEATPPSSGIPDIKPVG